MADYGKTAQQVPSVGITPVGGGASVSNPNLGAGLQAGLLSLGDAFRRAQEQEEWYRRQEYIKESEKELQKEAAERATPAGQAAAQVRAASKAGYTPRGSNLFDQSADILAMLGEASVKANAQVAIAQEGVERQRAARLSLQDTLVGYNELLARTLMSQAIGVNATDFGGLAETVFDLEKKYGEQEDARRQMNNTAFSSGQALAEEVRKQLMADRGAYSAIIIPLPGESGDEPRSWADAFEAARQYMFPPTKLDRSRGPEESEGIYGGMAPSLEGKHYAWGGDMRHRWPKPIGEELLPPEELPESIPTVWGREYRPPAANEFAQIQGLLGKVFSGNSGQSAKIQALLAHAYGREVTPEQQKLLASIGTEEAISLRYTLLGLARGIDAQDQAQGVEKDLPTGVEAAGLPLKTQGLLRTAVSNMVGVLDEHTSVISEQAVEAAVYSDLADDFREIIFGFGEFDSAAAKATMRAQVLGSITKTLGAAQAMEMYQRMGTEANPEEAAFAKRIFEQTLQQLKEIAPGDAAEVIAASERGAYARVGELVLDVHRKILAEGGVGVGGPSRKFTEKAYREALEGQMLYTAGKMMQEGRTNEEILQYFQENSKAGIRPTGELLQRLVPRRLPEGFDPGSVDVPGLTLQDLQEFRLLVESQRAGVMADYMAETGEPVKIPSPGTTPDREDLEKSMEEAKTRREGIIQELYTPTSAQSVESVPVTPPSRVDSTLDLVEGDVLSSISQLRDPDLGFRSRTFRELSRVGAIGNMGRIDQQAQDLTRRVAQPATSEVTSMPWADLSQQQRKQQ